MSKQGLEKIVASLKDIAKFPPELQIRQVPWNAEEAKYEK